MKQLYILLIMLSNMIHSNSKLTHLWQDLDHEFATSSLTTSQKLQLEYLSDKLQRLSSTLQQWTQNKEVATLLEIMELAVLESTPKTQHYFKEKIIQLFKKFHINVYFSNNGLITKINDPAILKYSKKHSTKLQFHAKSLANPIKISKPQKIKGANRTRKKLEKAWAERKKAEKLAAEMEQKKRNLEKKTIEPNSTDTLNEAIWRHVLTRETQTTSADEKNIESTENNEIFNTF